PAPGSDAAREKYLKALGEWRAELQNQLAGSPSGSREHMALDERIAQIDTELSTAAGNKHRDFAIKYVVDGDWQGAEDEIAQVKSGRTFLDDVITGYAAL